MGKNQGHRGNPFRGFIDIMTETNRAREQWLTRATGDTAKGGRALATAYVPPTDIYALEGDLVVRIEVPGVRREDVSLTVSGGMLTVSGYRDSELDDNVVYYTRERVYGTFRRSMLLPEGVQDSDVKASFCNGLLEIHVKGGAAARPRNIAIADDDDHDDSFIDCS
ncbi:Hsp20/alpha crystallin family protein [Salinisphaera sp.]|uniref:Hsp20/alpha crystallin family protein n=1 Tax=Salinisphaera sp. TaxID=1914330 RepID=UPI002D7690B9|nr:Hsp20/alpha crystallin family protein [Salinisphaera sp.]HET7315191.1 Hsp20/alpha crystallin family protein [Salinisphaera sp.]